MEAPPDGQMFQSFSEYSPRHEATHHPVNGMPTHFPQVANHDRMAHPDGKHSLSSLVLSVSASVKCVST